MSTAYSDYSSLFTTSTSVFPAPWSDYVSRIAPITITDALYWCEYVALTNQVLASSLRKLVSFFVTEIEVTGVDRKEQESIKDYLYDGLNIENTLNIIGLDYLVYGNVFISIWNPLYRVVTCPNCYFTINFYQYAKQPESKFHLEGTKYHLRCLHCGFEGPWNTVVVKSLKEREVAIIRWNPHDIAINYDLFSEHRQYALKLPPEYVNEIKNNNVLVLDHVPESVLEAAIAGSDFLFDDDQILHLYEPALAGLRFRGWGLSPILANFRQTWYIETLRRANQSIAADYILPLRILTPAPRHGNAPEFGDPGMVLNMGSNLGSLSDIIKDWRKDPTGWYSCPFPIEYQVLGGEGNRLIPAQLIEQGNLDLITALGLPVEYYRGSMTMQAAPVGLRLLEGTWSALRRVLNTFLSRLAIYLCSEFPWDKFQLRLARPSHIDDVNKQMARLQLAMNDIVSLSTGLASIGIDSYEEELKRKIDEQKLQAEMMQKAQEEMEMGNLVRELATPSQQMAEGMPPEAAGGAAPGGAVSAEGGAQPQQPVEALLSMIPESGLQQISLQEADQIAQQLAPQIFQMHPSYRLSILRKIKQRNESVHALVTKHIEELYNQAALQGKVLAQQGQL